MPIKPFLIHTAFVLLGGHALANDSSSELAVGGIVLVKNNAITMQREDLFLSLSGVHVRYEMRNDTGKPVTLRVAFPLPEIPTWTPAGLDSRAGGHNIAITPWRSSNFIDFRVSVNGEGVQPETEIRAILPDGTDLTAALREIGGEDLLLRPGLFEADYVPQTDREPRALDARTRAKLKKLGALTEEGGPLYRLAWQTNVTFHWVQTFPQGVTIVEHTYRPIIGSQFIDTSTSNEIRGSGHPDPETGYCIDGQTKRAIRKMAKDESVHGYLSGHTLSYILQTARNWKGPIETFHLTLQGGKVEASETLGKNTGRIDPAPTEMIMDLFESRAAIIGRAHEGKQILSLCTDLPIRKTGPLRFEATVKDYMPKEDLNILFVEGSDLNQ